MKKEFISKKESLALRKLGFEESCLAKYQKQSESSNYQLELLQKERNCNILKTTISAPLYQQAFRWFREKYNMTSFIQRFQGNVFDYEINSTIFKEVTDFKDGYFDTYEDAELQCLKKLIELVSNK